uniref:Uncharacterized protein n=1 Tax=Panstrongylus lignarius TaxID=156445 RepID=A0A224Y2A6_9HEMI
MRNFVIHSDLLALFAVVVVVAVAVMIVVVDCYCLALFDNVTMRPIIDCWPHPMLLSDVLVLRLHAVYVLTCKTSYAALGAVPLPLLLTLQ